jgi:aminopeptidase
MTDPRYKKLAKLLVKYSTALKKGERILLDMIDVPDEFTIELIRAVRAAGATPFVETRHTRIGREQLLGIDEKQAGDIRDLEMFRMKKMSAYIAIRGADNMTENSDVPSDRMQLYSKIIRPVQDYRVNKTRWCVLRWPTPSMAQAASMSTEAFENLYFDVCTMDYAKMARAMLPLEKLMKKTDRVHLKGPGTDLTFSIKGIGAKPCKGDRNIPDGERYDSIQHADALFRNEI